MEKICEKCGKVFTTSHKKIRFCSRECFKKIKPRKCSFCGKTYKPKRNNSNYCSWDCNGASKRKYNTFIINNEQAVVIDQSGKQFIVDLFGYEKIKNTYSFVRTFKNKSGHTRQYVMTYHKNKYVLLHRILLDILDDKNIFGDHISGDGLDNRMKNLRKSNRTQNVYNSRSFLGLPNVIGVYRSRRKDGKGFFSRIVHNRKQIFLGNFDNIVDAAMAYNKMAKQFRGEYARLNDINLIKSTSY